MRSREEGHGSRDVDRLRQADRKGVRAGDRGGSRAHAGRRGAAGSAAGGAAGGIASAGDERALPDAARERRGVDDGADPRHRGELPRRGSGGARDGAPALPERDRRLGRGRLRLPAARERRRRPPADEGRRARDRGADPRARAGEGGVPAGEERGQEGEPRRAGAAQPVHDQRRQPGPGRDAGGRDRVPADALVRRGRGAAALSARGGAALHPGPGDRREALRPRLGARHGPRPRRLADHAAARAGGRTAPQPGLDRGRARPRLSRCSRSSAATTRSSASRWSTAATT